MTTLVAGVLSVAGLLFAGPDGNKPPPGYSGKCSDAGCHDQYGTRTVVHDPISSDSCDVCHKLADEVQHRFTFTASGGKLCFDCHEEHDVKVPHSPAQDGDCTSCHDPHASQTKGLLKGATIAAVCLDCHEDVTEGLDFLHGPTAVGACTICHGPHGSDHPKLLFADGPAVCTKCHTAMQTRMSEKTYAHSPVKEDCTTCHNPHGAGNNMMLTTKVPDLCVDCHDSIKELMDDSTVKHDALTTGKSCTDCHQAHASNVEHILVKDPMDLCLSCHDKELKSGDDQVLNIAQMLRENPNHHGPIAQKSCTGCHEVHGGEAFRMLIEEYPAGFYAPFEQKRFAFCFRCHEADLLRDERTTALTNFRNGDLNMHYLHVNRKEKGRTCRACHSAHASKRPRHVTETVPFGAWELPVNFQQTSTGGNCLPGCHRSYGYDREKAVANIPTP